MIDVFVCLDKRTNPDDVDFFCSDCHKRVFVCRADVAIVKRFNTAILCPNCAEEAAKLILENGGTIQKKEASP